MENEGGEQETRYAGHHVTAAHAPTYRYRGYKHYFHDLNIKDIRLPPNPMDALLAFKKLG